MIVVSARVSARVCTRIGVQVGGRRKPAAGDSADEVVRPLLYLGENAADVLAENADR